MVNPRVLSYTTYKSRQTNPTAEKLNGFRRRNYATRLPSWLERQTGVVNASQLVSGSLSIATSILAGTGR